MDYVRHDFKTGEVLTADSLNHLEDGIALAMEAGGGVTKTTYAELKALRDAGQLKPGAFYRITDYETTTTQEGTQVQKAIEYDVIVLALSESKLSHHARACLKDGATDNGYMPETWQVWYSLDNTVGMYQWADTENGKGVVYRIIDGKGNDMPCDPFNIQVNLTGQYIPILQAPTSVSNVVRIFRLPYSLPEVNFLGYCAGNYIEEPAKVSIIVGIGNKVYKGCTNVSMMANCQFNTIGIGSKNIMLPGSVMNNTFGAGCSDINVTSGAFNYNTFADGCNNLNITSPSFNGNKVLKTEYVDISGSMSRCILLPYQGAGDYYDTDANESIVAMRQDAEQVNINIKDLASWWANK